MKTASLLEKLQKILTSTGNGTRDVDTSIGKLGACTQKRDLPRLPQPLTSLRFLDTNPLVYPIRTLAAVNPFLGRLNPVPIDSN